MKPIYLPCLISLLFVFACQTETEQLPITEDDDSNIRVDFVYPTQNGELMDMLSSVTNTTTDNGRALNTSVGHIDLEQAMSVEHLVDGTTRYTFKIEDEETENFKNVIIRKTIEGEVSGYQTIYTPNIEWLAENNGNVDMLNFKGEVAFATLDGFRHYKLYFNHGVGNLFYYENPIDGNGRTLCEGSGDADPANSGTGQNQSDLPEVWGGWGEFGSVPAPPQEGGGETTIIIIIIILDTPSQPQNNQKPQLATRLLCDTPTRPEEVVCEGDDALVSSCPSSPIGVLPEESLSCPRGYVKNEDGECVKIEDAEIWEEDVCLEDAFESNPCLMDIWNAMKELNVGYETLKNYIGDNPVAQLCFDMQNLNDENGDGPNGYNSQDWQNLSSTIVLNSENLNRSKLDIARTLLHEMIHSELFGMVVQAGRYEDLLQFAENYEGEDPFQELWEYYDQYGSYIADENPGWQHEFMADYYIQYIASGLEKLAPFLMSEASYEYWTGVDFCPSQDLQNCEEWNWNDFYTAMAWAGLKETDEWNTLSDETKLKFSKYVSEFLRLESSAFECN